MLEVARNADSELSPVAPLLNPTSFESTKASPHLFLSQLEITQLQYTCTLAALFYSMCAHMCTCTQTQKRAVWKVKLLCQSKEESCLKKCKCKDTVSYFLFLFLAYKSISWSCLQKYKKCSDGTVTVTNVYVLFMNTVLMQLPKYFDELQVKCPSGVNFQWNSGLIIHQSW